MNALNRRPLPGVANTPQILAHEDRRTVDIPKVSPSIAGTLPTHGDLRGSGVGSHP